MMIRAHWASARQPTLYHFCVSLAAIGLVAAMMYGVWYPPPLHQLADGLAILWIVIAVDLVCGPLLTFVVSSPGKSRLAFWSDISVIALIQVAALGYGVLSLYDARPVFVAFEGDRFRVVTVPDIDRSVPAAPVGLAANALPSWGIEPIGTLLLKSDHPAYLHSLEQALLGNHPSFRPNRWVPYDTQRQQVLTAAHSLDALAAADNDTKGVVSNWLNRHGYEMQQLRYLPLENQKQQNWIVLLRADNAEPVGYLALDGWR